jgi:GTP pyrophosphokinase
MSESERGRLLEAQWGSKTDTSFYLTDIRVLCHERQSLITEISKALAEMEFIRVINFTAKNTVRDTVVYITIEIKHREQLEKVINRLNNISGVYEVTRTCT